MAKETLVLGASLDLRAQLLWTLSRMPWSTPDQEDISSFSTDVRCWVPCEFNFSILCQDSSESKVCSICADTSLSKLSEKIILINCQCQVGSRATSILLSIIQNRLLVMRTLVNSLHHWRVLRRPQRTETHS